MAPLPFGKMDQVVDFKLLGRTALLTAATGPPQCYRFGIAPPKRKYRLLPVESAASARAVFTPALWERPRTVEAGFLGLKRECPNWRHVASNNHLLQAANP